MRCFASERVTSDISYSLKPNLLTCCGIFQIHTPKQKSLIVERKKEQKLIVSDCIYSNGTAVLANPAGHNHQRALVSLPDHNNSNKVEEAR